MWCSYVQDAYPSCVQDFCPYAFGPLKRRKEKTTRDTFTLVIKPSSDREYINSLSHWIYYRKYSFPLFSSSWPHLGFIRKLFLGKFCLVSFCRDIKSVLKYLGSVLLRKIYSEQALGKYFYSFFSKTLLLMLS